MDYRRLYYKEENDINHFVKKFSGVVLSVVMLIAVVSMPVQAQEVVGCMDCMECENGNLHFAGATDLYNYTYVNPNEHMYGYDIWYICSSCFYEHINTYYGTEEHTYTLNPETKIMTCDYCGDSYYHTW